MAEARLDVLLSLKDRASKDINKSFSRINDQAKKTERGVSGAFKKMNASASKLAATIGAVGLLLAMKKVVDTAIEFESAFAGVRKTVDATEKEFQQLSKSLVEMSTQIPVAAKDLAKIQELAGQLGVTGVKNLTKFTEVIAKIAVTTNLTREAAATDFARISNVMQESLENVDRMGAVVVDLGNNFATTEQEITEFAKRIAGMGKQAGLTTGEILAIGAAMSSVGIRAEAGGTAVQKVLLSLIKEGKRGSGEFVKFVEKIQAAGDDAASILEELGFKEARVTRAFLSLAGSGDILTRALETQNVAWEENNALNEEAAKRFDTTESKLKLAQNEFAKIAINLSTILLPALNEVLSVLSKSIQAVEDFGTALGELAGADVGILEDLLTPEARERLDRISEEQGIAGSRPPEGPPPGAPQPEAETSVVSEKLQNIQAEFKKVQDKLPTLAEGATKLITGQVTLLSKGIGLAFADMIVNGKSFEKTMQAIFKQMAVSFIAAITEMIIKWIAFSIISKALQAAQLATATTFASALTAIWAVPATLASIATGGGAAATGGAAVAASLVATKGFAIGAQAIPGAADGATINRSGSVIVGERGPELLNLPRGAGVTPLDRGGAGLTVNIENANFTNEENMEDAMNRINDIVEIDRRSRV